MATNPTLNMTIRADDLASAKIQNLQAEVDRLNVKMQAQSKTAAASAVSAEKLGFSWTKLAAGAAVATVGFAALKSAITDSISAAVEDQKSVTQLGQALNNLNLGQANAGLQAWVSSLQAATGESDTLIRSGLVRLVGATRDVTEAQSAMTLALDIGASGIADTESAVKALSAGYLGNTTALMRLKLPIDKAVLASKDMTKISAALAEVVGGQAAAAAETYAGKMKRVSEAASEAQESLGYGLLRSIDSVGNALGGADGAVSLISQTGTGLRETGMGTAVFVDGIASIGRTLVETLPHMEEFNNLVNQGGGLGRFFAESTVGIMGNAIEALQANLDHGSAAFARIASQTDGVEASFRAADGTVHTFINGIEQVTVATHGASTMTEEQIQGLKDLAKETPDAQVKTTALTDAMKALSGAMNQQQAVQSFKQAMEEGVKKPSADAAYSMLSSFQSAYDSFKEGGKRQAQFVLSNYAQMVKTIEASGLSDAAQNQLEKPLRLAKQAAHDLLLTLDLLDGKRVDVSVVMSQLGAAAPYVKTKSTGGYISGAGTGTSDSIPARLSNGEYVLRAAAVKAIGVSNLDMLNAQGYKKGGSVGPRPNANGIYGGMGFGINVWDNQSFSAGPTNDNGWYLIQQGLDAFTKAQEAAAKAAADAAAEAARQAQILHDQQQKIIGAARDLLNQAVQTRNDYARGVASTSIGFGSISGYSAGGSDWAALSARAPGSDGAGGPGTAAGSISGYMAGRLSQVRTFGDVLKRLALAGLNTSTLRDIIGMGPQDGATLGQALLDAGVAEIGSINGIQASIEDASANIGAFAGNAIYGTGVLDAQGNYRNVAGANGGDDTPLTVNLMLDGQVVLTQLLAIKRNGGGMALGLA